MKKFLCRIGIHLMSGHQSNFIDEVSGKTVYYAKCACGREWMVDSLNPLPFFKVERNCSRANNEHSAGVGQV